MSSLLAALAALVATLLVVPVGTAGATPATGIQNNAGRVSLTPNGKSIVATLTNGTFRPAGDVLAVVDKSGRVIDRVPLTATVEGTLVRVAPVLAANRTSVTLTPVAVAKKQKPQSKGTNPRGNQKAAPTGGKPKSAHPKDKKGKKGKSKRMTKGQAWDAMWDQLKADWPCASGYIGGGALLGAVIGAVLGLVIFSLVFAAYGAYIGAYIGTIVGYTECNKGAGRKAYEKWMATP
ncbi:hypothetical protein [Gordonia crocea]|uniref:hypothetical protein n=1 Tax=Gordonia crocea TaxID=589162 RepID=UPI00137AB411|nr:hypothetical protein [Gordonia crocea]